ncbi:asparagine synthase (glutamine-hydrolyzing) [Candidatus Uhrbacteria bacterium]|nr:asparagine synthase (glutamine-hydrolyzing) [Candidatus Uhrbacteria bacterium]
MCGIAGKLTFDGRPVATTEIEQMISAIAHRGPDDRGVHVDGPVGLGHARLAIIDLSPAGHQPMSDARGDTWITFNGEIYNFLELRQELERDGAHFRSQSDTEVMLAAYRKYGIDCVRHFRGMFAFAIWDRRQRRLLLARDRVGKKPLKYYLDDHQLIFASELKAILASPEVPREVDDEAIDEYLTYQYVPYPKTGFRGIQKLPPAHVMVVELRNGSSPRITTKRYWELDFSRKEQRSTLEWEERVEAKLRETVRIRLMSDVPLGAHLSGGIDSSLVVSCMAQECSTPVRTFSIGFTEDAYDERPFARAVAERFGTQHEEFVVEPDAIAVLPELVRHYEEPYADSSALPTWYLCRETRRRVTVALNGDGGDENFAGYTRYNGWELYRQFRNVPFKGAGARIATAFEQATGAAFARRTRKFFEYHDASPTDFYLNMLAYFRPLEKIRLYTLEFAAAVRESRWRQSLGEQFRLHDRDTWLDRALAADIATYLPDDLLVKVDIASMAHGLEVRSPFLDYELLELTAAMPPEFKLRGHDKKWLLKRIARRLLPIECVDRPKAGFSVPLTHWFRGALLPYARERLLDPAFLSRGFRREGVAALLDAHASGRADHANQLWALLTLAEWYAVWFGTVSRS